MTLTGAKAIASGNYQSCALLANGQLQCWGEGQNGALGTGSNANQLAPADVVGICPP